MPALGRHFPTFLKESQRSEETDTWVVPRPTFQEAGTWRGSVMAQAATIVASNTRLVHMFASFAQFVAFTLPAGERRQSRTLPDRSSDGAGRPRQASSYWEPPPAR